MFSFHLQWRFSTCISFAIRSLWERISPRVKVPSTFLKILISIQTRNFPVYSWKFWFLFKQEISQFIPGNFDFYSNEWFSTFKETERKGTHKWDEIEVKPEGGGGEKAGGPAVVVDVCHGVRCVCNLGNNFHFFYIFKYDWITFFSHLLHSFHFTLSPLENRFRFWCIWNLGNHKEMSRFWVGGQIWVLAPCSTRWHWQTLSRCPWSRSANTIVDVNLRWRYHTARLWLLFFLLKGERSTLLILN